MSDIVVKKGAQVRIVMQTGDDFSGIATLGKLVNHGFIAVRGRSRTFLVPLSQVHSIEVEHDDVQIGMGPTKSAAQRGAIAASYSRKARAGQP